MLIEPYGGTIDDDLIFFDIGQSRSLPWKRRPRASNLLDALREPSRPFNDVVIGEPHRAFYDNQFSLTFPVFVHYNVRLWVPEVGGAVDPGSDAHDLMMTMYGGMSKAERNRIKVRVRAAMAAQASTEGRFLGGRPPYGYQIVAAGPHPNPAKAADGRCLHVLRPDPVTAPVVVRIFEEYVAGKGIYAIAEGLTRDGIPCPSAYDPRRNPHRDGRAWSKSAVRAILENPRYTGKQVWNRQRRQDVLLDVDDVAAGYVTKFRWNARDEWVMSNPGAHPALVSAELFAEAHSVRATHIEQSRPRKPRATPNNYVLRQLIRCAACGRSMTGSINNGRPHYRCRFPAEYALANRIDHPKNVYVREDLIVPELDKWLASLFDEEHREATVAQLCEATGADPSASAHAEAARGRIADCDERLARYRAALDAGADVSVVAAWIAEVEAERNAAARDLARGEAGSADHLSPQQIAALVARLGDVAARLERADPRDKGALYAAFGLNLVYDPAARVVSVSANGEAMGIGCVRGET